MDWDEVVGHLAARHELGLVTDMGVELWQRAREDGRAIRQHLTVRVAVCHGQIYYVIEAEIAVPAQARAALCDHAELAMGTFVERSDALVAQVKVPASALSPAALDRILGSIAGEAMRLSLFVWQRLSAAAVEQGRGALAQQSQPPARTRSAS